MLAPTAAALLLAASPDKPQRVDVVARILPRPPLPGTL
jgi:hypothetical protein